MTDLYSTDYGGPVCDGEGCGAWACKLNYYREEDKFYCDECDITKDEDD